MTDVDVETTLREIRERVRAEALAETPRAAVNLSAAHGSKPSADALARLSANLATTQRTWSKLPPVMSFHRRGLKARLEIWVKRQIRRATHWYFFEQLNFNAAVNSALHDAASAFSIHEQALAEQRVCLKQLALEMSEQAIILDRARRAIEARQDELAAGLEELRAFRAEVERSGPSSEIDGRAS